MLSARNLSVALGGRTVLHSVSLDLPRGEAVAVIGPNGAGKSTLLRALAGEIAPITGEVLLDETAVRGMAPAELAKRRAVLPQSTEIGFPFAVAEVVALGLPETFPRRAAQDITERALAAVGLGGFSERLATDLSGGERQRVHLARAMAQVWSTDGPPAYLLLDEPTASLDLEHQLLTLSIARAHAAAGGGVLAVLHDLNLAVLLADRIVALKGGSILAAGPAADVLRDDLLHALYRVPVRVGVAPKTPFVLPQTAWPAGEA